MKGQWGTGTDAWRWPINKTTEGSVVTRVRRSEGRGERCDATSSIREGHMISRSALWTTLTELGEASWIARRGVRIRFQMRIRG